MCMDLGCGTGMLSIGAAFVCDLVLAVDCDPDALVQAQSNVSSVDLNDSVQFVQARVRTCVSSHDDNSNRVKHFKGRSVHGGRGRSRGRGRGRASSQSSSDTMAILILDGKDGIPFGNKSVDTVLTNPPFGTKHNAGIDVQFLRTACRLARRAVYSFHKRSTRAFLIKTLNQWGYQASVAAEMSFDIPQAYRFHTQQSRDVEVDLIRVVISSDQESGGAAHNFDAESVP